MKQAKAIQFFKPTIEVLERGFRLLERRVPPPIRKAWNGGFVFRYAERTVHQAIVQKLARTISGLHAVELLLAHGLFQEQGIVQRALDEIGTDIVFLSLGVINSELTQRHKEYLDYFYAEEFNDPSDIMGSHSSRGMVSREKINSYINRALGSNASRANIANRLITKAYSGFVHAASPHIMDMYGGIPPRFDVSGESRSLRSGVHADDALNYFLRALFSMAFAAKAFGDEQLFSEINAKAGEIELVMKARRAAD